MTDLGVTLIHAFVVAVLLVVFLGITITGGVSRAQGQSDAVTLTASAGMSAHEQDVTYLREEEKLARDVYLTLYNRWGTPVFANISQAEQRHMDQIGMLLRRYGLEDPVVDDTVGAFSNEKLEALYKTLVARGSASEVEALAVGAGIEELDLHDIITMKSRTRDTHALITLARLECGARNHLRAFHRLLRARGVAYQPEHLGRAELGTIVAGTAERCGKIRGRGLAPGWAGRGWHRGGPPHAR